MYKSGDLALGKVGDWSYDARNDSDEKPPQPWAHLPHSCDEWVIGGLKECRELMEDLQLVIDQLERAPMNAQRL